MHRCLLAAVFVIAFALKLSVSAAAEATLVLRGHVNLSGTLPSYSEDSVNFYGTNIFVLESEMLRHRTEDAIGHAAPKDLKIAAARVANTSVIVIRANSSDEPAASLFLRSLVDEFLKFKSEQKKRAYADAMARLDSALKAASGEAASELQKIRQQLAAASVLDVEPEFQKLPDK